MMRAPPRIVLRDGPGDLSIWTGAGHSRPVAAALMARGASPGEREVGLAGLMPPDGFLGAREAAAILAGVIERAERIGCVTDFDVDGGSSGAIGKLGFEMLGARDVVVIVPNRITQGYGLSPPVAEAAAQAGVHCLVTADNGVSAFAGVDAAKSLGMTVICTDHHLPGDRLPSSDVMVNPNQAGCEFRSKSLCGAGVLFYVLLLTRTELMKRGWFTGNTAPNLSSLIGLVGLATVGDMVPLDENNRLIVRAGLERIKARSAGHGIDALVTATGLNASHVTATDCAWKISPAVNAAGRIDTMDIGIKCLASNDADEATRAAATLVRLNAERKALTRESAETALVAAEELVVDEGLAGISLRNDLWQEGIIGLVASRLKEEHHRPACAMTLSSDSALLKASCRSIPGVHIRDVLADVEARHPETFKAYGGHAAASGATIHVRAQEVFTRAFDEACRRRVSPEILQRTVLVDGELASDEIDLQTAKEIEQASPWGQGFEEPLFIGIFNVAGIRLMGSKGEHVRYELRKAGRAFTAVHFGGAACAASAQITCIYRLSVNRWNGRETLQLMIEYVL